MWTLSRIPAALAAAVGVALLLMPCDSSTMAATPAIAAGEYHTVALKSDGTVTTWGSDEMGQLGTGRALYSLVPVRVSGLSGAASVSAGYEHVVALRNDGTVWAWGGNESGQLGDGSTTDRSTPAPVPGFFGAAAVSAGNVHTVARKTDGSLWAWGQNAYGQLGDGTTYHRSTPVRVSGLSSAATIVAGGLHTLALKSDGTLWSWGRNESGQLGDGTTTNRSLPVMVSGLSGVVAVSAAETYTVALRADGTVWAWGGNEYGQLGDGTTTTRLAPIQVAGLAGVTAISAGSRHTLALRNDGTVWAWGSNFGGALGDGTRADRKTPVRVINLANVTVISAGNMTSVAARSDGSAWSWGLNAFGQLGSGTTNADSITPVPVSGLSNVTAVSSDYYFTVAMRSDGSVWAWGTNGNGQLGDAADYRTTPAQVAGLSGVTAVSAGNWHGVALKPDGTVWSWGLDNVTRSITGNYGSSATQVPGLANVVAISAGWSYTLALKSDGSVWAWGENESGQLGDGTTTRRTTVAPVSGLAGVIAISAGNYHALALKSDGSVWAWGRNGNGQLGDGTLTNRPAPVRVTGLPGVAVVSAGAYHSACVKSDGTVWTWGANTFGQLGNGTTTDRPTASQVTAISGVAEVAAGNGHTLARRTDGSAWSWGWSAFGQIGDGATTPSSRSTPVRVPDTTNLIAISAGRDHSAALRSDGSILVWGRNTYGQLGDGTLAQRPSPVLVVREYGAGSIASNDWFLDLDPAVATSVVASSVPPFLMVASGAMSDLTADVRYRPQDVGTSGGVYAFAVASQSLVKAAANGEAPRVMGKSRPANDKDTPVACVLAQLDSSGQLQAVSASSLQAYVSGVLSSQGQAVQVINGVATANIAGATFYVGYGTSADAMINNGINRSVVTVPGDQVCQPQAPQTGWWWNAAEDGRGYTIESTGSKLFFAAYLYDISGRSSWYIAAGPTSLDGSIFVGDLESYTNGQTLTGPFRSPVRPPVLNGRITLAFSDAHNGTLTWPGGTVAINRMEFGVGGVNAVPQAGQPENGWWLSGLDDGRGFFIEWQAGVGFMAGFMYDDTGAPVWYIAAKPRNDNPQAFSSNWEQYVNGQTLTGAYRPPVRPPTLVGAATIQFQGAADAIMTMPSGPQVTLSRYRF